MADNTIGELSFHMSTASGTDSTVNESQTTTFYNMVTSVTYIGSEYDTDNQMRSPQYEIIGRFTARVKNDVSQQIRIVSNGSYKIVIGCKPQ
jgi:hypothetical protein